MDKAGKFIKDITYEDFASDEKTNYAVVRCVEIIGEAAKNIPENIRRKYPDIPWKKMAGMRDKISHFYFGIDMKKVWLAKVGYERMQDMAGPAALPKRQGVNWKQKQGERLLPERASFHRLQKRNCRKSKNNSLNLNLHG